MSADPFLLSLLTVMLSRHVADRPSGSRFAPLVLLAQLLLVPIFASPWISLRLLATLVLLQAAHQLLIRRLSPVPAGRLLSLLLTGGVLLLVLGTPAAGLRPQLPALLADWVRGNTLLSGLPADSGHRLLVQLTALWVASVELNGLITLILKRYKLIPTPTAPKANPQEPARGRVIGLLERGIVSLLALHGRLDGLALLLAVKGFARFKDLDDRNFAEYVLIGTLLSVCGALLTGLLFRIWL